MTATLPARGALPDDTDELADQAAPLDALLVRATQRPLRRFVPTLSTARFAAGLVRHPGRSGRRLIDLGSEIARVAAGSSTVTPGTRDRRFTDAAWSDNPVLRRVLQAYLADRASGPIRDVAFSVYFTAAFGIGAFWAVVIGTIIAEFGYPVAFSVMAASYLAAAALLILIRER